MPITIPADYPVQPTTAVRADGSPLPGHAECGECHLTWDDTIATSLTPAPSARCPFEPFHDKLDLELTPYTDDDTDEAQRADDRDGYDPIEPWMDR